MRPMRPEELGYPEPDQLIKVEPRTLVWRQTLPDGIPAVVKLYRRRGIHGLGGRCGLVRFRTAREYAALDHLTRHRIPCPEPLFWSHGVSAEHGQWEILATREIPGVLNIDDAIIVADTRDPLRLDLSRIFREASRIHRSGMLHGTLVARNILLEMRDGVLLVNPGSPTYPGRRHPPGSLGTLGLLHVTHGAVDVRLIDLGTL